MPRLTKSAELRLWSYLNLAKPSDSVGQTRPKVPLTCQENIRNINEITTKKPKYHQPNHGSIRTNIHQRTVCTRFVIQAAILLQTSLAHKRLLKLSRYTRDNLSLQPRAIAAKHPTYKKAMGW